MKYLIMLLLITLLNGCASKEERVAYYEAVKGRDAAVAQEYASAKTSAAEAFAKAMLAAAGNPVAQVAIAMSYMQMVSDSDQTPIALTTIDEPDTASDIISAISPIVTMGIVAGATAWGVSEIVSGLAAGTTYNLSEQSSVDINSDNNGSYNGTNGDSYSDDDINIGEETCSENPPGGFSPSGTPMWSPSCTCVDHAAGSC